MKNLKNYNEFTNEIKMMESLINVDNSKYKFTIDPYAVKYLNDEITALQLENYIFTTNEGIVSTIKSGITAGIDKVKEFTTYVKNKILDVFYTFLVKSIGPNTITKIINFYNTIKDKINSFKDKHPILFKMIIIFIATIIILIISTKGAHAEGTETLVKGAENLPASKNELNAAFGWLNSHSELFDDKFTLMNAQAYVKDMLDGKQDFDISDKGIAVAKTAISTVKDLLKQAKDSGDTELMNRLVDYLQQGVDHTVNFVKEVSKTPGGEHSITNISFPHVK